MTHNLSFFTEYYQFYILDAATTASTDAPDFWCDEATPRRLAIGEGLLGVTVAKYAEIKVQVNVHAQKPKATAAAADHVVEASLRLTSGILQVKDCTAYDTVLELPLEKSSYRIRISSFGLGTVVNDAGDDYYVVDIWNCRFAAPKIVKSR